MMNSNYEEIDGIKAFHSDINENDEDYNAKGLDFHYQIEEKHFWFVSRREFILSCFERFINKESEIIEIGAGTGNITRELMKNGYKNISVGEMHMNGLRYARSYGIANCFQFDLLRTPFEDEFDVVCMFDVLEHVPDEKLALENVKIMLKKNGLLVLSLPAHMWLWSTVDEASGHKKRYNRKELLQLMDESGFEVQYSSYFFIFIVPLLYFRALMNRKNKGKNITEMNTGSFINNFPNKVLLGITRLENRLRRFLPDFFGGSILMIARKR